MEIAIIIASIAVGGSIVFLMPVIITWQVLKHRKEIKMAQMRQSDISNVAREHEEFVLGVDARIRRLEDRIRTLESKIANFSDSTDIHLHRK